MAADRAAPGRRSTGAYPPAGPAGATSSGRFACRAARSTSVLAGPVSPDTVSGVWSGRAARSSAGSRRALAGAVGRSSSMPSIGVASATWLPYSPSPSEIAPALRPSQITGEPENPGPIPVSSTAGPDTLIRMRGPLSPASGAITSRISTSKDEIVVPLITDSPVQRIPCRTSDSGMIGSAARAAGTTTSSMATGRSSRRSKRIQSTRQIALDAPVDLPESVRDPTTKIEGGQVQSTLGEFQETQSEQPFALQNSKLLKVSLNQITIQAKAGAMVAYQGDVAFEHAGSGGLSRMVKKAMSGEGTTLMKMSGTGEVFLADTAQDIHLIYLENDAITVNGTNLLAFDSGIDWDIKRVEGVSGMMGGGLYNTALNGTGWVAIVSDGPPVLLNTGEAPTFADPQAAITWASSVQTGIKTDIKLKNFIGRGSGETVQMSFSGQGWVLVQPSEGRVQAAQAGGSAEAGAC